MPLTKKQIVSFQDTLFGYYDLHGRHDLPWRLSTDERFDPYRIVVSELMLQQTQVPRVIPKYRLFLERFPDAQSLAAAQLGEVLIAWQGLGYNRRAKFLWQTAQLVVSLWGGSFPDTLEGLVSLPGIGKNTAGAVLAYAYNQPAAFIETNVRTVFIYHFFPQQEAVGDADILPLVAQTLPADNARLYYWALMDYGTYLKQTAGNASVRSKHYVRQSPFHGSRRQVRGAVIRLLANRGYALKELAHLVTDERLERVLAELQAEGMVTASGGIYHLA